MNTVNNTLQKIADANWDTQSLDYYGKVYELKKPPEEVYCQPPGRGIITHKVVQATTFVKDLVFHTHTDPKPIPENDQHFYIANAKWNIEDKLDQCTDIFLRTAVMKNYNALIDKHNMDESLKFIFTEMQQRMQQGMQRAQATQVQYAIAQPSYIVSLPVAKVHHLQIQFTPALFPRNPITIRKEASLSDESSSGSKPMTAVNNNMDDEVDVDVFSGAGVDNSENSLEIASSENPAAPTQTTDSHSAIYPSPVQVPSAPHVVEKETESEESDEVAIQSQERKKRDIASVRKKPVQKIRRKYDLRTVERIDYGKLHKIGWEKCSMSCKKDHIHK